LISTLQEVHLSPNTEIHQPHRVQVILCCSNHASLGIVLLEDCAKQKAKRFAGTWRPERE